MLSWEWWLSEWTLNLNLHISTTFPFNEKYSLPFCCFQNTCFLVSITVSSNVTLSTFWTLILWLGVTDQQSGSSQNHLVLNQTNLEMLALLHQQHIVSLAPQSFEPLLWVVQFWFQYADCLETVAGILVARLAHQLRVGYVGLFWNKMSRLLPWVWSITVQFSFSVYLLLIKWLS